jgi:hypothetical protein
MIFNPKKFSSFFQLFFLLASLYWLPFINSFYLSSVKIFMLVIFLIIIILFNQKKIEIKFRNILFIFLFFNLSLVYEILNNGSGEYILTIFTIGFFYILGAWFSRFDFKYNPTYLFYLFCFLNIWVILSIVFPFFNYRNSLMLSYDFEDVMLSSTGFSIARTSWAIGIFLLSMFYLYSEKDNYKKFFIFFLPYLTVILLGARGGIFYFTLASVFIFFSLNYNIYKKILILFFFSISIMFFLYNFSDLARLSGAEDFTTGRLDHYSFFLNIFNENIFLGTYSKGFYDLHNYGLNVSFIHNAYLNILTKYGIMGSFPFLLLIFYSLINIFKKFEMINLPLYLLLLGGGLSCFFEPDTIFSYGFHILLFWFILGFTSNKIKSDREFS